MRECPGTIRNSTESRVKGELYMTVRTEAIKAYSDMNGYDGARNLDFKASETVTVDDAVSIMKDALDKDSYNDFEAELLHSLNKVFENPRVILAREGSVCVYVIGKKKDFSDEEMKRIMKASEAGDSHGNYRLWWD